jgi:hypothetical protein
VSRSLWERAVYTAAAPALAVLPNVAPHGGANLTVLAAGGLATLGGGTAVMRSNTPGRTIMRLSPLVAGLAVDVTAMCTPGWGWDALAAAGWAMAGWVIVPLTRTARRRHRPALDWRPATAIDVAPVPATAEGGDAFTAAVRALWQRAGNPAGTSVAHARPHEGMPHDLSVLLRAAEPGRPITGLSQAQVAAAFGVTEADVTFAAVPRQRGRQGGPGWLEVHVTPDESERRRRTPTPAEWWADVVAAERGPIPGSEFVDRVRDEGRGVTYWIARLPEETAEPTVRVPALCRALKVPYDDGRVFHTIDGSQILVSVWDTSPLARVYPATRELLTPDADGRWVVGYLANGQPARNRIYTDRGAAHGLYVAPSGGGKTQLMAASICADANGGAVVWLVTETPDEKTDRLGAHVDRQGCGALYMLRALRATLALMDIRARMPWADGQTHDWQPGLPGCPYSLLSLNLDEFLSATRHEKYGEEIMDLGEQVSVKGRKYAIGIKIGGQSVYVQDGFTQLLTDNLRENSIPVVLRPAPRKMTETFKALGIDDIPDPLPRSFSATAGDRVARIMAGQPEPPADSNTGGVGWIIENKNPEVLRTVFIDFSKPIGHLFPERVTHLTAHEIAELDAHGLWGDWNRPPDKRKTDPAAVSGPDRQAREASEITTPRQALEAIRDLSNA